MQKPTGNGKFIMSLSVTRETRDQLFELVATIKEDHDRTFGTIAPSRASVIRELLALGYAQKMKEMKEMDIT